MTRIPVKCETIDMASGATMKTETVGFNLMPPASEACPVCARNPAHAPGDPHDATSLYYQYAFYGEHGRWPTWKDAVAHCAPEVQKQWEDTLRKMGKWSEPAEKEPA